MNKDLMLPAALFFIGALIMGVSTVWYGLNSSYALGSGGEAFAQPQGSEWRGEAYGSGDVPAPDGVIGVPLSLGLVYGMVEEVGSDYLLISEDEEFPSIRITISSDTQIYREGAQKNETTYAAEVEAFDEWVRTSGDPAMAYITPPPFQKVFVSLSSIQPGTFVEVFPKVGTVEGYLAAGIEIAE